jgi:flagellar protein FliS
MADKDNNTLVGKNAMYIPLHSRTASAYTRVGVETNVLGADSHELINLLFNALLEALSLAQGAIERGDIPAKGKHLAKATRLIDEGLQCSLSPEGGELKDNLSTLYGYCILRLTHANLKSDVAAVEEVRNLIGPVAEGWRAIKGQALEETRHGEH